MADKDREREERLAAALRENLRRRKAQARDLAGPKGKPEVYGLPPDPVVTTRFLGEMWVNMATAAAAVAVGIVGAFLWGSHD